MKVYACPRHLALVLAGLPYPLSAHYLLCIKIESTLRNSSVCRDCRVERDMAETVEEEEFVQRHMASDTIYLVSTGMDASQTGFS